VIPITKAPVGLQSLLDIKQFGRNPGALSDEVSSVLDISDFYKLDTLRSAVFSGTRTVGGTLSIPVPTDELWELISMQIRFTPVGAGETFSAALGIGQFPGAVPTFSTYRMASSPIFTSTASSKHTFAFNTPRILLRGNSECRAILDEQTGAASVACDFLVLYYRYKV